MIINNSTGKTIHTQRNNKIRKWSACNVTSFINALKYCDIDFDYPKKMQPEDYFMKLMDSKEAWEMLYKDYGYDTGANPWNFSEFLVRICNDKLVGSPVCEIKYANSQDIAAHLLQGNVCTTSGAFTKSGHFVCIVGFESENDRDIDNFIIDDPFGNYHAKYRDHDGDNIIMSHDDFINIIKPVGRVNKRTQFFYRE